MSFHSQLASDFMRQLLFQSSKDTFFNQINIHFSPFTTCRHILEQNRVWWVSEVLFLKIHDLKVKCMYAEWCVTQTKIYLLTPQCHMLFKKKYIYEKFGRKHPTMIIPVFISPLPCLCQNRVWCILILDLSEYLDII